MSLSISKRGARAPQSPIRKLEPHARAAKERGVHIFSLNIGQPDLLTPDAFVKNARKEVGSILAYGPSGGLYPLRQAFAGLYQNLGLSITEEDLLITTGGSEAIFFALCAISDPGDEVITPEPFYPNYHGFSVLAGLQVKTLASSIENGFALPPPEEFEKAITPKTRAVILCNPSNPTGTVYSQDSLQALVKIARKHKIFIIADEVYREFVYDSLSPSSLLQIEGAEEVTIVIDSVSKRFAACGARIGCLVSKQKEIIETAIRFAQARLSPPVLGQLGTLAILPEIESFLSPSIQEYRKRRDITLEELAKIPGVLAPRPKGAFYLMARLPVDSSDTFCQWLLEEFSDDNQTVMLAPGSGFYLSPGQGEDEVRIAYVLEEGALRRAIQLIGKALKRYPGRK